MKIVITGYAGFIGSNLTRMIISKMNKGDVILGIDCHTYAARPMHVWEILKDRDERFTEANIDIRNGEHLEAIIKAFNPDQVYHLAAESHVCKSIEGPRDFATTNFMGTFNLLEALRKHGFRGRMVHVSTDEVYGELELTEEPFTELTTVKPRSPYSSSKAASDLIAIAYHSTYQLDVCVTRCSNNYGPNQHDEKLVPKTLLSMIENDPVTLYGNGLNRRDWIHVDDHCRALMVVMENGKSGEIYNIGSGLELTNEQVVECCESAMRAEGMRWDRGIIYTNDRPTDDKRYAINNSKVQRLGWRAPDRELGLVQFGIDLRKLIGWYHR